MVKLKNVHPGEVLLNDFLEPLGISQSDLANRISVPLPRINEIVLGKRSITADTALRLSRYFGNSGKFWMGLQVDYDLEDSSNKIAGWLEKTGMNASERASLPYCMGNAGDLLKHGVLAEYVRWRIDTGNQVRFLDLFAGESESDSTPSKTVSRIQGLEESALLEAQPEIGKGRYYGSSKLVRHLGQRFTQGRIEVFGEDAHPERAQRLAEDGLTPLSVILGSKDDAGRYDAYRFLSAYMKHAEVRDLVLIDPFGDFLPKKSNVVIPQIQAVAERAAVLLFALNLDPNNWVGKRFDASLEQHLPEAIIMTCPPLRASRIRGESKYYADVVLASPALCQESDEREELLTRLDSLAVQLGEALGLSKRDRCMLKPRVVGRS